MPRFLNESRMTPLVVRWLRRQGLSVKTELALPWGIPDLVGAALNRERAKKRLELRQREAIGPISRVGLLLSLPDVESKQTLSTTELQAKLGGMLSAAEIAAELAVLARRRFVRPDGNGSFQMVNGWMPLHDRLLVVELKLDRIDDALYQARKNKELTWESYVGLPLPLANRVLGGKRRVEFETSGVGVLGVSGRCVHRLLPAQRTGGAASKVVEAHCIERFWRAAVTSN